MQHCERSPVAPASVHDGARRRFSFCCAHPSHIPVKISLYLSCPEDTTKTDSLLVRLSPNERRVIRRPSARHRRQVLPIPTTRGDPCTAVEYASGRTRIAVMRSATRRKVQLVWLYNLLLLLCGPSIIVLWRPLGEWIGVGRRRRWHRRRLAVLRCLLCSHRRRRQHKRPGTRWRLPP